MKKHLYTALNSTSQSDANDAIITTLCRSLPSDIEADDGIWLPLIPIGAFTGRDGRSWTNSDPEQVVKNTTLPFILDNDHASEVTANTQASGWITQLKVEQDHILGLLELNTLGKESIDDKRYKFYSPAFHTTKDGAVHALCSVGLTNKPNLYVPALNKAQDNQTTPLEKDDPMLPELLAALGLSADADQATALNAINALKTAKPDPQMPDLNHFVPQATHSQVVTELNAANTKLAALETEKHNEAVETALNAAISEKKIAPADKAFYANYCSTEQGLADFNKFVSTKAPVIGDSNLPDKPAQKDGKDTELNSEQQGILAQMGVVLD
jgi:phage I-like protein